MNTQVWHLVTTAPKAEVSSGEWLDKRKFESFCPMWTKRTRRERNGKMTNHEYDLPAFPGYVFVAQDEGAGRFAEIEECPGVIGFIRLDGAPIVIPEKIVRDLRQAVALGCFVQDWRTGLPRYVRKNASKAEIDSLRQKYRVDEPVKVIGGPFADFVGSIASAPVKDRIKVLLAHCGAKLAFDMPVSLVEPLT